MRAVVLAGGQGTRLRPYTAVVPKPLIPIGDRPILEHILRRVAANGVQTRQYLCVGHLGQLIQAYFSHAPPPEGVELRWHWEDEPLGTAGALNLLGSVDQTFIVMNGDISTNLDFAALVDGHRASGATLTVAMHAKEVGIDLGVIESREGFISAYREKPTLHYDVSMGIYVYEPRALDFLPMAPCTFPDLVNRLLAAGEPIAAHRSDADWYDIGTFEEYERASRHVESDPHRFAV